MGFAAWMVGAVAAVAVSMLALAVVDGTGSDIQPPAPEPAFATGPANKDPNQPAPTRSPPRQPMSGQPAPAPAGSASQAISTWPGAAAGVSADPSPSASAGPPRQFTTSGGALTAQCIGQLAYLVSWSPSPGYRVDDVRRGPAAVAQVAFDSTTQQLAVGVSCASGFPQLVHVDE